MKLSNIKKTRGQGMTEYLVVLALIAVAAITAFGLFGGAARNQLSAVTAEISGGDGTLRTGEAVTQAGDAADDADENRGMGEFTDRNTF